jgi:hypothetical protein
MSFAASRNDTVDKATLVERLFLFKANAVEKQKLTLLVREGSANASELDFPALSESLPHDDVVRVDIETDEYGFFKLALPVTFNEAGPRMPMQVPLSLPQPALNGFPTWSLQVGVHLTIDPRNENAWLNSSHRPRMESVRLYSSIRARMMVSPYERLTVANATLLDLDGPLKSAAYVTDNTLSIISDIDVRFGFYNLFQDTIKVSNITGEVDDIVKLALFRPYDSVLGMPELYQQWSAQIPDANLQNAFNSSATINFTAMPETREFYPPITNTQFFFVSGCPWQLSFGYRCVNMVLSHSKAVFKSIPDRITSFAVRRANAEPIGRYF